MRKLLLAIALLVAAFGAAAIVLSLPPFRSGPTFYENVGPEGQKYTCDAGYGVTLHVRFVENGRIAIVRVGDKTLRLAFRGTSLSDDVYEGGGWTLSLDPEVNLSGPGKRRFSNCS